MNETVEFLVRHGAAVLFATVFVEQMGVPLPAAPWLLAAGALAAAGKLNWLAALTAAAFGSVLADLIWFYLGRYGGQRVLNLLCRISLEPTRAFVGRKISSRDTGCEESWRRNSFRV